MSCIFIIDVPERRVGNGELIRFIVQLVTLVEAIGKLQGIGCYG